MPDTTGKMKSYLLSRGPAQTVCLSYVCWKLSYCDQPHHRPEWFAQQGHLGIENFLGNEVGGGSSAKPLWSSAPCATFGWAACIKKARAPAVINHCSSCKRQLNESGPSNPGSGCGSLIGNSLDMGAPLAQWIMRIASRDVCISIFTSTIGVGSAGYGS
jgi:hypothetical protein